MTPIERDHERGLNGALAAEIRAELAVRDKSQTWLAAKTDMDRLTLRRYLKAQRGMNTAIIEAIAVALGVDAGDLMARAVVRRDRHPELYGPEASEVSVYLGATGGEVEDVERGAQAAVDALDAGKRRLSDAERRREAMQQLDNEAARDEDAGA